MGIKDFIKGLLALKGLRQADLADRLHVTRQNLNNKLGRGNLSLLEMVEIADALSMELVLRDRMEQIEYRIDFPKELKGRPKRNNMKEQMLSTEA